MKILKTLFIGMIALAFATAPAYGDSNGKGKGAENGQAKGHEKQAEERANPASNAQQERQSQPDRPAPAPQRNTEVHIPPQAQPRSGQERANHPTIAQPSMPTQQRTSQGNTRNSTSSRANGQERNQTKTETNKPVRVDRDRSADRVVTGRDENRVNLADVVSALEKARWSYNPHDTRGQGNVGQPRMWPPYGFDKDSGREKKERRRPIWDEDKSREKTVKERPIQEKGNNREKSIKDHPIREKKDHSITKTPNKDSNKEKDTHIYPKDTDGDGIKARFDPDDDNDGVLDTEDAFPLDSTESRDYDKDGIGNNADIDDDNDGVLDTEDAFPFDFTESKDADQDGIGNNADTDDDNDGVLDTEDLFPLDSTKSNLAEILSIDFILKDPYYRTSFIRDPLLENYINSNPSILNILNGDAIKYTLTLDTTDGIEGTKLLVTTSIISAEDYTTTYHITGWDSTGKRIDDYHTVHYDAGETMVDYPTGEIVEKTQEVVLGTDNTLSLSYTPSPIPDFYGFIKVNVNVTVTEPKSGQSYTMNYDNQLYLWRCPYGKVYNAKTRQPVVGAKVTVHFEDGSIVPLDKASNPTAKNPQLTDATGRYGVKLQTDRKYYITAKADGYEDYKSEVFTEKWHVLREDIALTPLEQVAQK